MREKRGFSCGLAHGWLSLALTYAGCACRIFGFALLLGLVDFERLLLCLPLHAFTTPVEFETSSSNLANDDLTELLDSLVNWCLPTGTDTSGWRCMLCDSTEISE